MCVCVGGGGGRGGRGGNRKQYRQLVSAEFAQRKIKVIFFN